jgi:hypothetical protein
MLVLIQGTAFFMPLEIHLGRPYKTVPTTSYRRLPTPFAVDVDPFDGQLPAEQHLFSRTSPPPPPRLNYRSQHGLESLWWVALYILIYRVDHPAGNLLSNKIFTSTSLPTVARQELFEDEGEVIRELKQALHPALQHKLIMDSMHEIARVLFTSYFMDNPTDPEALGQVYHHVFRNLAILVLTIKTKVEVEGVKFRPTHHVRSKKRARPETSFKPRDDDEYKGEEEEEEEEPSSEDALPKRRKKASSSASVRR